MFKPNLTRKHSNYRLKDCTSLMRMFTGIAAIRSNLMLAIRANIVDVKFYHNTIASIGPHFKQTVATILSVDSFYVR